MKNRLGLRVSNSVYVADDLSIVTLLQCVFSDNSCKMLTEAGEEVGDLNMKTFRVLNNLKQSVPLRYEGIIMLQTWEKMIDPTNNDEVATMDINIYGPQEKADFVAAQLCHAAYFLQDPLWCSPEILYMNPQHLDFPNIPIYGIELATGSMSTLQADPQTMHALPTTDTEDLMPDFSQLLDNFAQHDHLIQETADAHITTELKGFITLHTVSHNER